MSFAQGDSTQPLGLVASNVFVTGKSLYGNALTVQQLTTGNILSVSNANGTTGLFVNQSSNVGVGTTNPGYSPHVVGDVNFTGILRQSGTPYAGSQWTTGTTNVYYFSNVGIGTSAVSANLTVTGNVYASNAIQTANIVAAGFTSNSTNTVFNFDTVAIPFLGATTLNVASTTNVYSLTALSNVGIGTGSPSYLLHVNSTTTGTETIASFLKPSLASGSTTYIAVGSAISNWQSGTLEFINNGTNTSNVCRISIYGGSASMININSTGVGIGVTTPQTALWVPASSTTTGIGIYNADVAMILGNTAGSVNSNTEVSK